MYNKPEGFFGPDEEASMRPDEKVKVPAVDSKADGYFNPGKTFLDHRARCDSVMRRGMQQRLKVVMHNLVIIGIENLTTRDLETLALVQKELVKVEGDMVAAGQEP